MTTTVESDLDAEQSANKQEQGATFNMARGNVRAELAITTAAGDSVAFKGPNECSSPCRPRPVSVQVRAVTNHTAELAQRWWQQLCMPMMLPESHRRSALVCAQLLIAAGRGAARIPSCEHTLLHAYTLSDQAVRPLPTQPGLRPERDAARGYDLSPVLARALSLFGPGELRALRVGDPDTFRVVLSLLPTASAIDDATGAPRVKKGTLDYVCALELVGPRTPEADDIRAVVERCAATVTELSGRMPGHLLSTVKGKSDLPVLARCVQLEALTHACNYDPAVWLGLSQLHTLLDVDLRRVSTAAIAAALPRLHTLKAFRFGADHAPQCVAGFFEDLLPRLRVFRFGGIWPDGSKGRSNDGGSSGFALPFGALRELVWDAQVLPPAAQSAFNGAQPTLLHAPYNLVANFLTVWSSGRASDPLRRVRDLHVMSTSGADPLGPSDVARVLQAAPQLRKLRASHRVRGGPSWITTLASAPIDAATAPFMDPAHRWLRHLSLSLDGSFRDPECAARLRRHHFPRLQEATVNGVSHYAIPIVAC